MTQWLILFSGMCLRYHFGNVMPVCNNSALMFAEGQFQKAEDSGDEIRQNLLLAIVNAQIPQVVDTVTL